MHLKFSATRRISTSKESIFMATFPPVPMSPNLAPQIASALKKQESDRIQAAFTALRQETVVMRDEEVHEQEVVACATPGGLIYIGELELLDGGLVAVRGTDGHGNAATVIVSAVTPNLTLVITKRRPQ